jgi:hypothetical protein
MAKKKSDVFAKKPRGRSKKQVTETVVAAPVEVVVAPEPVVEVVLETPAPEPVVVAEPVVEPEVKKEMPRGLAVAAQAAPPQAKRKGFWELFTSFWR